MKRLDLNTTSEMNAGRCCECGVIQDEISGSEGPVAGHFAICIICGSLNMISSDLSLRPPTDEEIFEAAKSSAVQMIREAMRIVKSERKCPNMVICEERSFMMCRYPSCACEVRQHRFSASAKHMGDCQYCGHPESAEVHV